MIAVDLFDQPHAGAQDVGNVSIFQFFDRFGADHAPVGNDVISTHFNFLTTRLSKKYKSG